MSYDGSLKFDTKVDHAGFASGIAEIKSTAMAAITAIGTAFATGAIAKAIVGQISALEEYGSTINDQSQKLSVTTKAYQELSYMMGQTGGSADTLQMGIKTLSSAVVDGNKAFDTLGISLEKARSMSSEDLFNTVINQLASMESGTLRTSLAADLFGRSATELAPLLNMGAEGIAKMRQEAASYGLIMSDKAVAATDEYGDATELAKRAAEGLRNTMLVGLMPTLTGVAKGFADIMSKASQAFSERGVKGVVDVITDEFPVATAAVSGLAAAFVALLVIQTVQKSMAAYAAVQASLTALEVAGTAQEWAEIGALTAKQLIVGALSGSVQKATAAQWLFNAAVTANPVMLLVTAVGLLVGGIVLVSKNMDKIDPQLAEVNNKIKAARESTDALAESVEKSAKAYEDNLAVLENQEIGSDDLVNALFSLSDAYVGSSLEQRKMQAICDELNNSIEGLNLSYDISTGAINQNKQAIKDIIASKKEEAVVNAQLSRYTELMQEQTDATYNMYLAQKAFDAAVAAGATPFHLDYDIANNTLKRARESYKAACANVREYNGFLAQSAVATTGATEETNSLTASTDDLAKAQERITIAGVDVTDALTKTGVSADDAAARLDNYTGAATNMFEKIDTKPRVSVKSMIDNLTSNTAAFEQWGDNIALLGDKLPSDLLQPLIAKGPQEMAGVLNALANSSDAELALLSQKFNEGGAAAKQAWLLSFGLTEAETTTYSLGNLLAKRNGAEDEGGSASTTANPVSEMAQAASADTSLNDAVTEKVTEATAAMTSAVSATDYSSIATAFRDGVKAAFDTLNSIFYDAGSALSLQWIYGMLSRKTEMVADARLLAEAVNDAFRDALDLSVDLPSTTDDTQSGSGQYGPGSGGGSGNGTLGMVANTIPSGLASSLINTEAAKTAIATYNTTNNVAVTVQGVVESDAKLAKRVTKEFQEVTLYGNG